MKENRKLTPIEIKQREFLLKEYPMLDECMIETAIRLTDAQRDVIVEQIENGELKHDGDLESDQGNVSLEV